LWLATDRGLVQLGAQGYTEFTSDNSELPGVLVADLLARRNDAGEFELWASTHHGLAVWSQGRLRYHDIPGMPELDNFVRAMVNDIDADGRQTLWAATQDGLFWYDNRRWRQLALPCVANPSIFDLKLAHGALWMAGRGGIARIGLDAAHACSAMPVGAAPPKLTYRIEFDRNGRLYAFGYDGVARLTPPEGDAARLQDWSSEHFSIQDGLPDVRRQSGTHLGRQRRRCRRVRPARRAAGRRAQTAAAARRRRRQPASR
jgi:ligand-binding sensor domain-containing protein